MIDSASILQAIRKHKIVAILRGAAPSDVLNIARAMADGGVRLLEITMNSQNALSLIEQLGNTMGDEMIIGAGTVLDPVMARQAIAAGAQFIISPSTDTATICATKDLGKVSIPGAYTPTEIVTAYAAGADIIKIFPIGSNINYFKDLQGPLSHIPMMPTGGITPENIHGFQQAGAVAFGIGSALINASDNADHEYLQGLTIKAKKFMAIVKNNFQ
jgi:2-dehydro-3-deoxyphosphogluconate aldolase/(4S)-4-hydroxy-2-oxoglutarate aldolase